MLMLMPSKCTKTGSLQNLAQVFGGFFNSIFSVAKRKQQMVGISIQNNSDVQTQSGFAFIMVGKGTGAPLRLLSIIINMDWIYFETKFYVNQKPETVVQIY